MATIMGRIRNVMARRAAGETLAENEEKALTLFQNRYPDRYNEIAADLARERWGTP
jgi:hypothetical protein